MSFLNVNGIDIPIMWNGCSIEEVLVGVMSRAYDGTLRSTVRARKREWKLATSPLSAADALFYTDVLRGNVDVWNFDNSDLYSAKGNTFLTPGTTPGYGTGGVFTSSGITAAFGNGCGTQPGLTTTGTGWLGWFQYRQDSSGWDNWIVSGTTYYKNGSVFTPSLGFQGPLFVGLSGTYTGTCGVWTGASSGAPVWAASTAYGTNAPINANNYLFRASTPGTSGASPPTWPTAYGSTVVDGSVVWTNTGPNSTSIDCLQMSTTYTPTTSQIALLAGLAREPGLSPRLSVTGDMVNSAVVQAVGDTHGGKSVQFGDSTGTWQAGGQSIEFTLREV